MKNIQSANKPVLKNRKINDATNCLYSHLTLSDILLDFDPSFQQVCMQPMKHLIETNTALFSLLQNSIENRIACYSYSIQVEKEEHSVALDKIQFVTQGQKSNSLIERNFGKNKFIHNIYALPFFVSAYWPVVEIT